MEHELVLLSEKIGWSYFEKESALLYSEKGQLAEPIRPMVGCLLLKHLYNLGDETLPKAWVRDPYMRNFCGEAFFRHRFPFNPSDFVHFRWTHRRGWREQDIPVQREPVRQGGGREADGLRHNGAGQLSRSSPQTRGCTDHCNKIAQAEGIPQRQTYTRKSKALLRICYNTRNPKRRKNADAARRKLHTMAGRQVRELLRKLPEEARGKYAEKLSVYIRILEQTRTSKDKVYSPHKPYTACIAKGKASHEYEFGNKVGVSHPVVFF